jgi:hypothetical protein
MLVSRVFVNQGETRRETGFLNAELKQQLGLVDDGPGRGFYYAFQLTFYLHELSPEDLVLARNVHEMTYKKNSSVISPVQAYERKHIRLREGWPEEQKPDDRDVKRERNRLVIQHQPHPTAFFGDRAVYPLAYEGRFYLKVENDAGDVLAGVEYYVRLLKRTFEGRAEGDFELINSTVFEPALRLATRLTLNPWLQNWDLCRLPNCSLPRRLPMQMDKNSLRGWLSAYHADAMKLAQVRSFLWHGATGPEVYRYPDDVLLDQLADQLWCGRLHAHARERTQQPLPDRRGQATVYIGADFGNDYTPFPMSERKPRAASSAVPPPQYGPPEPATFPPDVALDAQAATLVAAAQSGAPCVDL